tara:strand:+ start:3319 stop:3759 length:441 start_codon:yes stop_codon:yes gene_type:complete
MNIKMLDKIEYENFAKYLSVNYSEEIHNIANNEIEKHAKKHSSSLFDIFENNSEKNFINFFYLDFLSKYFFKNSFFRFKLNLILALNEADYENFNIMRRENSLLSLAKSLIIFVLIAISAPFWLILRIIIFTNYKIKNCFHDKKKD